VRKNELHNNINNKMQEKSAFSPKKFCIYFILKEGVFRSTEADHV